MRGLEVSTTSPRLASTSMFWIMFSSIDSCRVAKAGSLGGRVLLLLARLQIYKPLLHLAVCKCAVRGGGRGRGGSAQIPTGTPTPPSPNTMGAPCCHVTDAKVCG